MVNGRQRFSYGSYIIQEVTKGPSGILLAALLGGLAR